MCQILKMSYNNKSLIVEVSSKRDLTNCVFKLLIFDFYKGEYSQKPLVTQNINSFNEVQDSGNYSFKYDVPNNAKIKCVIMDGERVLATRERYIGERQKISVSVQRCQIKGRNTNLYTMKSDVGVSKKIIYFNSPASSTKINIPESLEPGNTHYFSIDQTDSIKFKIENDFLECFSIE